MVQGPAKTPCNTCPYRQDVPSGVWAESEYRKLALYDLPTGEQPPAPFACHKKPDNLCAGWVGTHDMHNTLGLRLALSFHWISPEDFEATLDYESPVPLFETGAEACAHGMRDLDDPSPEAREAVSRVVKYAIRNEALQRAREAQEADE